MRPQSARGPAATADGEFDAAHQRWRREAGGELAGKPNPTNRSGIEMKPLYTGEDWDHARYLERLGFPGQAPMTRGVYASMYRGRSFSQRQLIGLGVPDDYNRRLKAILAHGGSAVSLIPCNSVYRGFDADELHFFLTRSCAE